MTSSGTMLGLASALTMAGASCDDAGDAAPRTVDAEVVRLRALTYADGDFERVTREARPSQHAGDDVHVWVSKDVVGEYLEVDRDTTAADPDFPEGAMIVKEQLDGDVLVALTVMYKGPAGSAPDSDDWYWERVEADGTLSFSGQVAFCIGCHTPRRAVDWVFGVEADNLAR